ncbi:putative P-loop containing nucleoside triphosphate hydrolase protein [Lyophyllum shimeji]|uniref:P-loop containing nucleoside triphosphate hydrolase protein n=1 Tax=Lyophyllum shimeji TaxID=47721 RepID=A0A9P3PLJ4_LYOSH|nr:putative P-loop containing nucleoside triphosphate hydrolase protein [Lyophyllum shimeji]
MPPCRFYNSPGGCRNGAACTFSHGPLHDARPTSSASTAGTGPGSSRQAAGASPGFSRRPQTGKPHNTPPGVCTFYWSSGKCHKEFDCRYRHTLNPALDAPSAPSRTESHRLQSAAAAIAPFLTEAGLVKINAFGTDAFFSTPTKALSPNEAHNALKRYLYDDFRFLKTFDVYGFLAPLSSANSNSNWTSEDGQLLLNSIATGNGLLRIADIIQWSPVSTQAGSDPRTLSFQRGFLPLLRFYSSDLVVKSTLSHLVNGLYMCIMHNCDTFCEQIEACMDAFMAARSFKDRKAAVNSDPIGSQVIASLAGVFFECLTRFKNSTATHPGLLVIIRRLREWTDAWTAGISATPAGFDDPFSTTTPAARDHIISHLRNKVDRLVHIVDREEARLDRAARRTKSALSPCLGANLGEGIIAALRLTYDGPGDLSVRGRPRHDNDFIDIQDIRIAPTHEELIGTAAPFLPANLYGAPHHLPNESMERLLDIQFRLLREELTAPLRTSVQLVWEDFLSTKKTRLDEIIKNHGGRYRGFADTQESITFNVYTGVKFLSLLPDRRGLAVSFSFDSPPGRARSPQSRVRKAFWEGMSGKRMMRGGLVALVWKRGTRVDVHLGVLASSVKDLTESAHADKDRVSARIIFFDPDVELRILQALKEPASQYGGTAIIVEAPVMFEAIRPFLEALRVEPESVPFSQYLVHRPVRFFSGSGIRPPQYARIPGFAYQLAPLFPHEAGVADLKLYVNDADSVAGVLRALERSRLDLSQASAVVEALSREVALIQGPPGTGKSFTGVELLRVLIPTAKPILMIAFTNHALDHLMTSVLDAGITDRIVRLGSRSADERIKQFSIEELEVVAGDSRLNAAFKRNHRELKLVEEDIKRLMKAFTRTIISSEEITQFLESQHPEHYEHILSPPTWISAVHALSVDDQANGWQKVGKRRNEPEDSDNTLYAFWLRGRDLDFLSQDVARQVQIELSENDDDDDHDVEDDEDDKEDEGNADEGDDSDSDLEPWERFWDSAYTSHPSDPEIVQPKASEVPPPQLPSPPPPAPTALGITDLQDPIAFFAAHGYACVPELPTGSRPLHALLARGDMWTFSITERKQLHGFWEQNVRDTTRQNHLDDFKRLREKYTRALEIYNEGKDEARRQLLMNVDIIGCTTTGAAKLTALLKGLAPRIMLVEEAGQVLEAHILGSLVPSVEHLILIGDPLQLRPTLNNYSLSVDSKRGSQLYRFDMSLMERLSSSGFPMSQIDVQRRMRPAISNLIRHTLYPQLVDHELVKTYPDVRGFAKNVFFLSHNHRENDGGEESSSKYNTYEVSMIKDLVLFLLRQGCYSQEGDIVVLCAYLGQLARVRDALADSVAVVIDERDQADLAEQEDEQAPEFLDDSHVEHVKVSKRVRLRTVDNYQGEEAKIIILSLVRNAGSTDDGRARQRPTIGFLKSDNRTNVALSRAKEGLFILGNAPQMSARSPMWRGVTEELEREDCLGDGFPIACQRHPDAVKYISEPGQLQQFAPDGGCLKSCDARLKCGHACPYKCHPDDPAHITVTCSQSCRRLCERRHPCKKECAVPCGDCVFEVPDVELPCGHTSPFVPCYLLDKLEEAFCQVTVDKNLPNCEHIARMRCSDDPSQYLCTQPCTWACPHYACPLPCGSVCARLPCDKRCDKVLNCGHRCPSVCGEDCSIQVCPRCASPDLKEKVVDLILGLTLEDILDDGEELDNLLITLPRCRHVFTVETLDGLCEMEDYYTCRESDGKWLDLKSPVSQTATGERKKPPVCPTCRSAITSPRYGRIFKSADLDILERNVIARLSSQLDGLRGMMERMSKSEIESALVAEAARIVLQDVSAGASVRKACAKARKVLLNDKREVPMPKEALDPGNKELFIISPPVVEAWNKAVKPLVQLYDRALKVAGTRSAHARAWEAAWSCLVEQEMERATADPARAPRNLNQYAMQIARMKVGQPQPRADKRFMVEAFWTTVQVRLILSDLAHAWLTAAGRGQNYTPQQSQMWAAFAATLLDGCRRDAQLALNVATASESRRQMTKTSLLIMRVNLERFRFDFRMAEESGNLRLPEERAKMADKALAGVTVVGKEIQDVVKGHVRGLRDDAQGWIVENFTETANLILQEWQKLEKSVRNSTFYEPISLEEKMNIVRAFDFSHGGHFYNCPNGHTFVIGECGGAMERARCPECNAVVGGSDHTLTDGNTRATEFEDLARQAECAVAANPLSQVLKHTEGDRSLQQDRSAGSSTARLHHLPGTAPLAASQQDVALARQFFEGGPQTQTPVPSFHASELARMNSMGGGVAGNLNESWVLEQQQHMRAFEESHAQAAWAAEFQTSSPPPQQGMPTRPEYQQRQSYMPPMGSYGTAVPMGMYSGFNAYPGVNSGVSFDAKGKGKAKEVDFEAAFAQVAASLASTHETTSSVVEVEDGVSGIENALKGASLDDIEEVSTDFKKVWDHLQDSELPPPQEDLSKWESEFNQLMSAQRDELDHDYGASMQNAWESGIGNISGTTVGEQPLKFDAEGIPILGEYTFEQNNKYLERAETRSLLKDAKALLEQNGSLSEAALLLEAAIQKGELGEGGYEAWILLGETRNMDEREEAGMRALIEGVRRAEEAGAAGAGMMSLAISFTNESYDRASHTMLLRWVRARFPDLEIPESTIEAMATHSSWDTHNRITELFLSLARSQHMKGTVDADVQIGLGVLFYTNGEYDRAKDCFESALAIRPNDYTLWNRLGSSLSNGSKPEEALGAYQEALRLRPTYTRAIYNVGVACLNIGAYKEAAEHFLSALNLQESISGDTSDQLWYTLRRALISMDRPDLADLAKPEAKSKIEIFRKDGFDF